MTAEQSAFFMIVGFTLGLFVIVAGGVAFSGGAAALKQTRDSLSPGIVFAAAGLIFVAGISVHFTGSSNTAFLKGQMARATQCELEGESVHPDSRGGKTGVIARHIVSCMASAGYDWSETASRCQDAPVATNGYCYVPATWFDRTITTAQLAFD